MTRPEWTPFGYAQVLRGVDEAIARAANDTPAWRRRIFLRRVRRHVAKHFPATPGDWRGGAGFGDGTGVREPRRPMPTRPSAAMALPLED